MKRNRDRTLILIFAAFALLMVGLAVIGGFRNYSPVPHWDMWDGTLEFFMRIGDSDYAAWWDQHNEHRIVLSRLLFFANLKWFGGLSGFLVTMNYVFVGVGSLIFWRILRDTAATKKPTTVEILLGLVVTGWLFFWTQKENLTWAFQSHFFLAQLLPLCALYWLHKSIAQPHAGRHFLVASTFGVASVGTMANGTLALPLMTLYALVTRQSRARTGALAALSTVTLFLYFHDYQAPANHGSLSQALKENPLGVVQYVLLYVGSPFYYLLGKGAFGTVAAQVAAAVLIIASARLGIRTLRQPTPPTLPLALLFFMLYIGGTALGTAGGRLLLGVTQALSSRYTTPAVMVWAAFLMLHVPAILAAARSRGEARILVALATLAVLMLDEQVRALRSQEDTLFEKRVAALALELGAHDAQQIENTYPSALQALRISERASVQNLSIFGAYPLRNMKGQLGLPTAHPPLPTCLGSLDTVEVLEGESRFLRISGRMASPDGQAHPQVIRFLEGKTELVTAGYAISGPKVPQTGYRGYLLATRAGETLTLIGDDPACQMQVTVPPAQDSLGTELSDPRGI